MRKIINFLIATWLICLSSCLDDQTTGAYKDVSDILISATDTVLLPSIGEEFVYDPSEIVSQTREGYSLSYQWRLGKLKIVNSEYTVKDSLKIISNEKVLRYTFYDMSPQYLRLRVTNEFGSTYQYFVVRPSSNFDEGLIILSGNDDGDAMLSMLNTFTDEEELLGKEAGDFWFLGPEDMPVLKEGIVDLALIAGRGDYNVDKENYLYLLSKNKQCAYYLDHRTMEVINDSYKFSVAPLKVGLIYQRDETYGTGFDLFAFCTDGDVHPFSFILGQEVDRYALADIHYWDRCQRIKLRSRERFAWTFLDVLLLFDDEHSTASGLMNQAITNQKLAIGPKSFPGEDVINIGFLEANVGRYDFYVVLQNKENPKKITVQKFSGFIFWEDFFAAPATLSYSYELEEGEELSLTRESIMFNCFQHRNIVYNNKYKIFNWFPNATSAPALPSVNSASCFDVRNVNPNAEITCMTLDVSNNYLFVGVYDPTAAEDRKGSIYVLSTFDFSLVTKFENIAWKPIELYYKPNVMRSYGDVNAIE